MKHMSFVCLKYSYIATFQHSNEIPPNVMSRLPVLFHWKICHNMETRYSWNYISYGLEYTFYLYTLCVCVLMSGNFHFLVIIISGFCLDMNAENTRLHHTTGINKQLATLPLAISVQLPKPDSLRPPASSRLMQTCQSLTDLDCSNSI